MATLIDSLVVALSLDPTEFESGQKKANDAFTKTRKEAEVQGKKVEQSSKGMADGVAAVTRRVLEMYAVFLGGKGLKQFVTDIVNSDAVLGRFASNIGMQPQLLSEWQNGVERIGGSASAVAGTMANISTALYDFNKTGKNLPDAYFWLGNLTKIKIPTDQGLPAYLNATAAALAKLAKTDRGQAYQLGKGLGLDDGTINLMIAHGAGMQKYLDTLKNVSPTEAAILASEKLQAAYAALQQQVVAVGNKIVEAFGPTVVDLLNKLSDWFSNNQPVINAGLREFGNDALGVFHAINSVVDALGGVVPVTEAIIAIWTTGKILGMLAKLAEMAALLGGIVKYTGILSGFGAAATTTVETAAPAAGTGVIAGFLLRMSAWATLLTLGGDTKGNNNTPATRKSLDDKIAADPSNNGKGWWSNLLDGIGLGGGSSGGTGPLHGSAKANAQESVDFWMSKGLSKNAALAMVGDEQGESGFDPHAVGDGGTAHGSFQWHSDRGDAIYKATGINVNDPATTHAQMLKAAYAEMSQGLDAGAARAWAVLKKPGGSVTDYTTTAVKDFERSLHQKEDIATRADYGTNLAGSLMFGAKSAASIANPTQNLNTTVVQVGTMHVTSSAATAKGFFDDTHRVASGQYRNIAATANGGMR